MESGVPQEPVADRLGSALVAATAGVSVLAAAAPALCAVHCMAMPIIAVALPSLQLASRGSFCMHAFSRRLALYFVAPLGLTANAFSYSNHGNGAVTTSSLFSVLPAWWLPRRSNASDRAPICSTLSAAL